jgi:hypothetical protein
MFDRSVLKESALIKVLSINNVSENSTEILEESNPGDNSPSFLQA